jgi:hypothetical protein
MAHQSDAAAVPVDQSRVITPSRWLAPRERSRLSPGTAGDDPAVELGQGGGNAGANSHFFLITKDKVNRSRLNFGFPTEQVRLGSRLQDDAGNELTQRTVGGIQQLTDRGEPQTAILLNGRFVDKSFMTDSRPVAPEIVAIDVAKPQPDSRMHGGMVGRILTIDRRMAAGDLPSSRRMGMSEIRSFDGTVPENIVGNRRAIMSYH